MNVKQPTAIRRGLFLVLAVWLAWQVHHYAATRPQFYWDALILWLIAGALAALAFRGLPSPHLPAAIPVYGHLQQRRLLLLGGTILAAALAFRGFRYQADPNTGLLFWLLAIALLVAAFWRVDPAGDQNQPWPRWEVIALLLIVAAGLFVRFYQLDRLPPGLYLDEGDNGLEALRLLDSGRYAPFTRASNGHPTLYLYLLGIGMKFLGTSGLALRMVTALIGSLAILTTYLAAREMLARPAALAVAFLMAFSRWEITFSRIAFEGVLVPLTASLAFWLLLRALRTGRRGDFVWAGLALSAGLNGYIAFRVFPGVIALYLLHRGLTDRSLVRRHWQGLALYAVSALLAFLPLGLYFLENPNDFTSRARQASVLIEVPGEQSGAVIWQNVRKTLFMFSGMGDPRPRHNVGKLPTFDPASALLLTLGAGLVLWQSRRPERSALVVWAILGIIPGVLSLSDSNPHTLRTITILPAVYLMIGTLLDRLWVWLSPVIPRELHRWQATLAGRPPAVAAWPAYFSQTIRGVSYATLPALVIVLLVVGGRIAQRNLSIYFDTYARDRLVLFDFDPTQTEVGQLVAERAGQDLVLVAPVFTNHADTKFLAYQLPYQTFNQAQHLPVREPGNKDILYILEPAQRVLLSLLQTYYPTGQFQEVRDRFGGVGYLTYRVEKEQIGATRGLTGHYFPGDTPTGTPALERRDETINFLWATGTPLPVPFTGRWQGTLQVPQYGNYTLILRSPGPASLSLDEKVVLETPGGDARKSLSLVSGFQSLVLTATVPSTSRELSLFWITPGGVEQVIPATSLYAIPMGINGLVGKYYANNHWSGSPTVIQKDSFVFANDFLPGFFSIEWEGRILLPRAGTYTFGTRSDDGSQLWIDDKLVVDNGGHHSDRYVESRVALSEGWHDLRLRYFQDDGGKIMELWWIPPGGSKEQVPTSVLYPPGVGGPVMALVLPTPTPPVSPVARPSPGATPPPGPAPSGTTLVPVAAFGQSGNGPGQFTDPRGVAVDSQGRLYVADTGNGRVQSFDANGHFLGEFGRPGRGESEFQEPADLAVDAGGTVYVLDPQADSASRFSSDGRFLGKIGVRIGLYRPRGLALDATGTLYIANTGGNAIVKLSPVGEVLGKITGPAEIEAFDQPVDVAVGDDGSLFVVEPTKVRLVRLSSDGRYLGQTNIASASTVYGPHLATIAGLVLVTDPDGNRVVVYNQEGTLLGQVTGEGSAVGRLYKPVGIAADSRGNVYVADAGNHRIVVFQLQ